MSDALVPYKDLEEMAKRVVESRLFPVKSAAEAITMFLLCQAEGLHPMRALRMFDIIQGRPAIKPKALMASLAERGGRVEWIQADDQACIGKFYGRACPDGVTVKFDIEDAKKAGLLNKPGPWQQYRADMLRHRCTGRGVDMVDPGAAFGLYSTPVVQDFDDKPNAADYEVVGDEAGKDVGENKETPAPPAIESTNGLTTEEYLAEAKKRREEAAAEYVVPPPSDKDVPFEALLEREREKSNAKHGRPKSVPDFCKCGQPVMKFASSDGTREYWECSSRHADRYKLKETGMADTQIRKMIATSNPECFFKDAGKVTS